MSSIDLNNNDNTHFQGILTISDNENITESTKYDPSNNIPNKKKKKVVFSENSTIESLLDELNSDNKNEKNIKVEDKTIEYLLDELNSDNKNKINDNVEERIKIILDKLNGNSVLRKPKNTNVDPTVKVNCDSKCIIS
jgi:predicted transcriptional regulator